MATSYPGGLDSFTNPVSTDLTNSVTVPHATQHSDLNDAVEAIEAELGVNPSGGSATVVARLDLLATAANPTFTGTVSVDSSIVFEGSTADAYETTLTVTDPTADRTITLPNLTGTVSLLDGTETLTNKTITAPVVSGLVLSDASVVFEGATADAYETTLTVEDPTADRTVTIPNATDTLVGKATTDTLTNKSINLANNTVTGTLAEFNTAVSDANLASIAGAETLTNKTLTAPVVTAPVVTWGTASPAASATQTQGGGTAITAAMNRVTVVASANDALTLPAATAGTYICVKNAHATNAIGIFPAVNGYINALAQDAVYTLPAEKMVEFRCVLAGTWDTILTA